ncbi:glycosyltransferase family 4 protein [Shewanella chilikensis]|uniref:glycosyltransferase family 4 protein n=1 Tax=Shewanella chilikensis TaxID=558541 RepID=UPI003006096F
MARVKILYIVNVDWFFISHRLPIAVEALKVGYEVHIACSVTDRAEFLEDLGFVVHPLNISRSGVGVISEVKSICQLFKLISNVKPQILHTITIKPVLYANLMARILKVPFRVSSISGLGYVFIASGLKSKSFRFMVSLLYRLALKKSNVVIFQNQEDARVLRLMGAVESCQEALIRGSGVDLTRFKVVPEPKNEFIVMLVARLLIDKGVVEFVEAAKILKLSHPEIKFVLVGDIDVNNPKSITDSQLEKWVEEGIIQFWGFSNNISETMSKSNVIVLPSYREGLPKSLIEAAASGRAVITTDVAGCRDAIEPNRTGLLVPVREVEPLVGAILNLRSDDELRLSFGRNGRELAEKAFDINSVVKKHLEIYKRFN